MTSNDKAIEIKNLEMQEKLIDGNKKLLLWLRSIDEKLELLNDKEVNIPEVPSAFEVKNFDQLAGLMPQQKAVEIPKVQDVRTVNVEKKVMKTSISRDSTGNISSILDTFSDGTQEKLSITRSIEGMI